MFNFKFKYYHFFLLELNLENFNYMPFDYFFKIEFKLEQMMKNLFKSIFFRYSNKTELINFKLLNCTL